jgi:hypothetical protein
MSWNIQKPGDYINGPLTVAGQQTLNNLLAIRGTPTFPLSGVGLELFYSPTNLNSNIYSYNRTTSGWAELVFGSSNTIFQINGTSKVAINSTGLNVGNAPNANLRAWALQGFGYINGGDGNGIEWRNSGTGNSAYITNDNDRLNFNFPSGVGLTQGNLRFANGNGIDFSLSPNAAGATSEILNDYEEGTFTASVEGSTTAGAATYVVRNSTYTKVGRLVQFQIHLAWNSGSGTGALRITGLPFTANGTYIAVPQVYPIDIALVAGFVAVASVQPGTSYINIYQIPSGGGSDGTVTYDAAGQLIVTGTYIV